MIYKGLKMGNWNISIRGIGQHHNESDKDVDRLMAAFIVELAKAGQFIEDAALVYGGKQSYDSSLAFCKTVIKAKKTEDDDDGA